MWVHVSDAGTDDDGGGSALRYMFAREMVRALVFAATPEDARSQLFTTVLTRLEEAHRLRTQDSLPADASAALAAAWADWARLARGANQHVKAAACFLAAAQASITAAPARGLVDASRAAHEGIASLRTSASAAAERAGLAPSSPRRSSLILSSSASSVDAFSTSPHARISSVIGSFSSTPPWHADGVTPMPSRRRSSCCPEAETTMRLSFEDDPECADLLRGLDAVLDTVLRVQSSWALLQPDVAAHALTMTGELVSEAPSVAHLVRGKRGLTLTDPLMGPVMIAHQATLLRLVGTAVAGQRDWDGELAPTLLRCGRMHARFGETIREFYPPCGRAMMTTLRGALGGSFFLRGHAHGGGHRRGAERHRGGAHAGGHAARRRQGNCCAHRHLRHCQRSSTHHLMELHRQQQATLTAYTARLQFTSEFTRTCM